MRLDGGDKATGIDVTRGERGQHQEVPQPEGKKGKTFIGWVLFQGPKDKEPKLQDVKGDGEMDKRRMNEKINVHGRYVLRRLRFPRRSFVQCIFRDLS